MTARQAAASVRRRLNQAMDSARTWPPERLLLALGVVAFGIALGIGLLFVKVAESVWRGEELTTTDVQVHQWAVGHRTPWLTDIMRVLTDLGGVVVITGVTVAVVVVALVRRRPGIAGFMLAATAGTMAMVEIVKAVIDRPRPATIDRAISVTGAAFPSGHAAGSLACYGALAVIVIWTWRLRPPAVATAVTTLLIALLVGLSRVYLGVHWPSDVLAGWALAASWLAGLVAVRAVVSALRLRRSDH